MMKRWGVENMKQGMEKTGTKKPVLRAIARQGKKWAATRNSRELETSLRRNHQQSPLLYLSHRSQWYLTYSLRSLTRPRRLHLAVIQKKVVIRKGTDNLLLSGTGSTKPDCMLWRV
jgi:hypothetical protein